MAHPIVLDDAQKQKAIELRQVHSTMAEIADRLMISRATLYNILDREPEFSAAMQKAYAGFFVSLRRKLSEKALAGDTQILLHVSKSILKNVETQKIEAKVSVSELSDEELLEKAREVLARQDKEKVELPGAECRKTTTDKKLD